METVVVGPKSRRGRKRKRNNVGNMAVDIGGAKNAVETRSLKLVGRYVQKEFQGSGVLLGRVMLYDSGLYRIKYEDGHCEDLISSKVKAFMVEDSEFTGDWLERKKMLNEVLSSKAVDTIALTVDDTQELDNVNLIDSSLLSELTNCHTDNTEVVEVHDDGNGNVDADSSIGSCDDTRGGQANMDMEVQNVPPPELPPSSGHIGIPEEYGSYLLSVYSFLRSFSVRLFLYPFSLDEFVGALNCSVANILLDSVHFALMRVLKRQIDRLSSDGSEPASKLLRCLNWSLLDSVTWPIYLVHYLMVMGCKNGDDWKEFYTHCLENDYYTLSTGKKLIVLQILCEEVLDTEELRTEMDMRVESEVGVDMDTSSMVGTICEPGSVHPRFSETTACNDIEAVQSAAEHCGTKYSLGNHSVKSQVGRAVGNSTDEDGNGDECRLCGMDGFLVCCDGCPSSYHPRCLGLNKMIMPDGLWYCPECKINASEPKMLRGTTLRGGDILGVDPYKQVFIASCDHLLVLKASIDSESRARYYNRRDIPGVLHALCSRAEHVIMYSEICRGVMQYWELFPYFITNDKMSDIGLLLANKEGSGQCITQLVNLLDKVPEVIDAENHGSCVTGICADMAANCDQESILSENSLDKVTISDRHIDSSEQQCEITKTTRITPASFNSLNGRPGGPCELSQQNASNVTETVSTKNSNIRDNGPLIGNTLEAKASPLTQELNNSIGRRACGSPHDWCLYMGSSFKTTDYMNHYSHGDFAASAAANLAIVSCKENQAPKSCPSDNHRTVMSASIALQMKALSSAAVRFFWPNTEKKLVEVPRERCGWCFSCETHLTSKRGCLLNAAASNAIRGAMKVLAGVRPVKNGGDSRFSGIQTYLMFMEESLSGLLVGPFLDDSFRKQWQKQVQQATTCKELKILLLELEENIRSVALSGDWMKVVECFHIQSSICVASASGSTQKCKPGRRGRKRSSIAEVIDGRRDMLTNFTWWRGGILSTLMFQRGILPCSIIKKAACQGGIKKISGIHYVEGNEIPKSSRQLVWRSVVEMSRNVAQLALQVRYLDFHVRWGDLVHPEQTPWDGKGPETEASAFRKAFICDKKIVEREIRYCVAFGTQKHLPSRVMKGITEIEKILDEGKERYWFSESYIPLHLIKEYEQKVENNKPVNALSKLQRKQLKASRENIFSFLLWKQENTASSCCSCHQVLFYRNAVKCNACQGFCHKQCAASSTVNISEEIEFSIICKQCCETQHASQVESNHGPSTSSLPPQGQDFSDPATTNKHGKLLVGCQGSAASLEPSTHSFEVKSTNHSAVTKKNKKSNWGLIWRKKNCEDTGIEFRLKNILLRGNADMHSIKPPCRLCNQPYNADLMYIHCETCKYWYHADAVEMEESKIFSLVGFKCCKCRRIKSPICPYLDPEKKKILEDKIYHQQAVHSVISMMGDKEVGPDSNPLLASLSEVKQCSEGKSEVSYGWKSTTLSGPQPRKLPLRRYADQQKDVCQTEVCSPFESNLSNSNQKVPIRRSTSRETNIDCYSATNSFRTQVSDPSETNAVSFIQRIASSEKFDDSSTPTSDFLGSGALEFEPQTILSFNEFLESDDGGNVNGKEPLNNVTENRKSSSAKTGVEIVPCKVCSKTEPGADLCCEICGMWIHRHCSPWFESASEYEDEEWRCGNCREWR